jgi:hypothetical protein
MVWKVELTLTYSRDTAALTLLDPLGLDITWTCNPPGFLSKGKGKWSQGLGSQTVILTDRDGTTTVLQIYTLNMFDPKPRQSGNDAIASGDGGTVGDLQFVNWTVDSVE